MLTPPIIKVTGPTRLSDSAIDAIAKLLLARVERDLNQKSPAAIGPGADPKAAFQTQGTDKVTYGSYARVQGDG